MVLPLPSGAIDLLSSYFTPAAWDKLISCFYSYDTVQALDDRGQHQGIASFQALVLRHLRPIDLLQVYLTQHRLLLSAERAPEFTSQFSADPVYVAVIIASGYFSL